MVVWQVCNKLMQSDWLCHNCYNSYPRLSSLDDRSFDPGNLWVELPLPEQSICLDIFCLLGCWDVLMHSTEDSGASCSLSWFWAAVSKALTWEMVDFRVCKRLGFAKTSVYKVLFIRPPMNWSLMLISERSYWQFGHVNLNSTAANRKCTAKLKCTQWIAGLTWWVTIFFECNKDISFCKC